MTFILSIVTFIFFVTLGVWNGIKLNGRKRVSAGQLIGHGILALIAMAGGVISFGKIVDVLMNMNWGLS